MPSVSDADGTPAELGRLVGEAVPGNGRQHEVERVLRASAVRGRVGEWADGLEQLDDRTRPAVRHDQRQRVLVRRLHVDEVDVEPVDLGLELRQRVQSRLALAPVVIARPVAGELLHRRQLHTLRPIGDEFPRGPAGRLDAAVQFFDLPLGNFDSEWADPARRARGRGVTHDRALPVASLSIWSMVGSRDVDARILGERRADVPDEARGSARFTRARWRSRVILTVDARTAIGTAWRCVRAPCTRVVRATVARFEVRGRHFGRSARTRGRPRRVRRRSR